MKLIHKAILTVFAKEDEDEEAIKQTLISLVPFNLEEEKIELQQQTATSFKEKKIRVFKIELEKTAHTNAFMKKLLNDLTPDLKKLLLRQAESRLDKRLHFFIRFDKLNLITYKKLLITDSGECFHLELSIAAFPSKREVALEIIEKIFKVE
jgi:RNA binding exosome subunit